MICGMTTQEILALFHQAGLILLGWLHACPKT